MSAAKFELPASQTTTTGAECVIGGVPGHLAPDNTCVAIDGNYVVTREATTSTTTHAKGTHRAPTTTTTTEAPAAVAPAEITTATTAAESTTETTVAPATATIEEQPAAHNAAPHNAAPEVIGAGLGIAALGGAVLMRVRAHRALHQ